MVLTFGLFDAGNDWWWAVDNIHVEGKGIIPEPGTLAMGICAALFWCGTCRRRKK
jgi:hypothetical protein